MHAHQPDSEGDGDLVIYLDYPIRRHDDGHLTIHRPNGRVLLAGRIAMETAQGIVRRHRGEYPA